MTGGLALSRPVPAGPASRAPSVGSARAGGVPAHTAAAFVALVDEAHRARERGHRWTGLDHSRAGDAATHDLSRQQGTTTHNQETPMDSTTTIDETELRNDDARLIGRELDGVGNLAGQLTETLYRAADSIAALEDTADADRLAGAGRAVIGWDEARLLCAVARAMRRGGPFG